MKNTNIIFSTIAMLLIFLNSSCDLIQSDNNASIQASGVVEASEIIVAPEVDGKITEVLVSEGDKLATGDPLFRIEDELIVSQLHQAESALSVAQANYDLVAAGATPEQKQAAQALLDELK